jgi:uracil-DNA glycosylase
MDLFYGTTFEENITAFKADLKKVALSYGYNFGKKKVYIAYGDLDKIGNCILFIGPALRPADKAFQDKYSEYLFKIANEHSLNNIILTSCFPIPLEQVSKTHIKEFNPWMEKLVDIFRPRLIVALGEDAQFSFVKRKHILRDYHGQIISKSMSGTDVLLTYPMSYYLEKSEYEDPSYKTYMLKTDFEIISKLYKERIK